MNRILLFLCLFPVLVCADLRLPNIFSHHMILQREKPVTVWGWGTAGADVTVEFSGQSKSVPVNGEGRWSLSLDPLLANSVGQSMVIRSGLEERRIDDIVVGDVWLCGGQSNMEWTMRSTRDADMEIPSANYPGIRFLRLPKLARNTIQDDFPVKSPSSHEGNWKRAVATEVENCTGVGYYFAKRLHRRLGVPVGIVDTSWGGTMAQHWVTRDTLELIPEMKPYIVKFDGELDAWEAGGGENGARKRYEEDLRAWESSVKEARVKGEKEPQRPNENAYRSPAMKHQPGGMMNGVLMPVASFTYKGILFYQGENNSFSESWKPFYATFPAVVSDWRKVLKDDLPFGIVQIAGWSNRRSMSYDMNHHCNVTREIQYLTWKHTEGTGLIATYDTNSNGSIHPGRKAPVGERAARWALAQVYKLSAYGRKEPLEWQGPDYENFEVKDGKVLISFAEGSARGLRLDQDVDVGFYIAGENREFHHARARVDGGKNQLVVWHDEIKEPKAVRYAFSNLPMGGLMNGRELPAFPFRTDDWPITPHQSVGDYEVSKARAHLNSR